MFSNVMGCLHTVMFHMILIAHIKLAKKSKVKVSPSFLNNNWTCILSAHGFAVSLASKIELPVVALFVISLQEHSLHHRVCTLLHYRFVFTDDGICDMQIVRQAVVGGVGVILLIFVIVLILETIRLRRVSMNRFSQSPQ